MSGKQKGDVGEIYDHSQLRAAYFVLFPDQQLSRVDETLLEVLPAKLTKNEVA